MWSFLRIQNTDVTLNGGIMGEGYLHSIFYSPQGSTSDKKRVNLTWSQLPGHYQAITRFLILSWQQRIFQPAPWNRPQGRQKVKLSTSTDSVSTVLLIRTKLYWVHAGESQLTCTQLLLLTIAWLFWGVASTTKLHGPVSNRNMYPGNTWGILNSAIYLPPAPELNQIDRNFVQIWTSIRLQNFEFCYCEAWPWL